MPFFVIFILIPLAEVLVFMRVSDVIGLGTALFMALFTAIVGGAVVRHQGIQTLTKAQKNMHSGQLPSQELFDGLCIVAAGATLITPGFITDALGCALLIPAFRNILRKNLSKHARFQTNMHHQGTTHNGQGTYKYGGQDDVIDVTYETIDDEKS